MERSVAVTLGLQSMANALPQLIESFDTAAVDRQRFEANLNGLVGPVLLPQIAGGLEKLIDGGGGRRGLGALPECGALSQDES
jgi:hypothetical protein